MPGFKCSRWSEGSRGGSWWRGTEKERTEILWARCEEVLVLWMLLIRFEVQMNGWLQKNVEMLQPPMCCLYLQQGGRLRGEAGCDLTDDVDWIMRVAASQIQIDLFVLENPKEALGFVCCVSWVKILLGDGHDFILYPFWRKYCNFHL